MGDQANGTGTMANFHWRDRGFPGLDTIEPVTMLIIYFVQMDFILLDNGCQNFRIARIKCKATFAFRNRIAGRSRIVTARNKNPAFRAFIPYSVRITTALSL